MWGGSDPAPPESLRISVWVFSVPSSRTSSTSCEERLDAGGTDQTYGTSEADAPTESSLGKCKLAAQSPAEGQGEWRTSLNRLSWLPFMMAYGIDIGMELRIDKAGRIVVPKPLRERLGFKPDTELEAIEQPEGVLLKRVEQQPSMVKVDGLWVHQGSAESGSNWDRILEDVREERIASVLKA